jgi:OmcA/MtrC family decaheme c-type cytochrome
VVSNESCAVCHGQGKDLNVASVHNFDGATGNKLAPYTVTATITGVTFTPVGDNVITRMTFTFATADAAATAPTINLLDNSSSTQLRYARFSIAHLDNGTNGNPNEWFDYTNGSRVNGRLVANGGGSYTYTFPDNTVTISGAGGTASTPIAPFDNAATTRVAIQISGLPAAAGSTLTPPVANPTFDLVPNGTAIVTTKNNVTIAACNACHDPLSFHGGGRIDTKFCVVCHNPTLPATDCAATSTTAGMWNFGPMVHKIHTAQNIGTVVFSEIAYPQTNIGNCSTCHKGTDPYFKTRPSIEGCGSCHSNVNFATGAGHIGGAQPNNSICALCHSSTAIPQYHANKEGAPPTPNNPTVAGTLAVFEYGIDSVTVDNTNAATVTFWIKKGGVYVNFLPAAGDNVAKVPAGFSGSPSFLVAHGGTATNTQDYSNFDEIPTGGFAASFATAQPKSVTIVGLPVTATDNTNTKFRAKLTGANTFPAGAKMRAVALQGYFTQISGGTGLDNVGRHTPAVSKAVTGDTVRRTIVKSGYDNVAGVMTPVGCLECHEVFEGHGGNRVNNVQVCVMCHNPGMTTSARTIPDNVAKNPAIVADFPGSSLTYPEIAQNMAEMIHGIHASKVGVFEGMRVEGIEIIRNRAETPNVYGVYINGAEVTYPGDLSHCTKCHYATTVPTGATANSYKADLPAGVSFTTEKITTGNASETLDNIIAARKSFPNATDLVDSPVAGKCGYCHDTPAAIGHIISNGGDVRQTRSTAELTPPSLGPAYLPAP